MDTITEITFEEARRQLFDPTVEDEDIRLAETSIRCAEEMRTEAQANIKDTKALKKLEKTLDNRIKSQKKWIRTLKEIQSLKISRQNGLRQAAF